MDLVVVEAEVVADFVDEDVGDDLVEADVAALAPFIEDGAAVEEDARWLRGRAQAVAAADVDMYLRKPKPDARPDVAGPRSRGG